MNCNICSASDFKYVYVIESDYKHLNSPFDHKDNQKQSLVYVCKLCGNMQMDVK